MELSSVRLVIRLHLNICPDHLHSEAITHNDQHAGQAGNFSPDRPGTHVDIYW